MLDIKRGEDNWFGNVIDTTSEAALFFTYQTCVTVQAFDMSFDDWCRNKDMENTFNTIIGWFEDIDNDVKSL